MAEQESTKEAASKCTTCGKSLKRIKRYYRNGNYFCNNRCFKLKKKEAAA